MSPIRFTIAAVALCAYFASFAQAQEPANGLVNSVVYTALPPGTSVEIQFLGDTEVNQSLRNILARELELRGYPVVATAGSVVLRFDSDIQATDNSDRRTFYSGAVGGNQRSDLGLRVRPFSRDEPTLKDTTRYNLTLTVGPHGGSQYWIGRASVNVSGLDRNAVARAMALAIMDTFNTSVKDRPLEVD